MRELWNSSILDEFMLDEVDLTQVQLEKIAKSISNSLFYVSLGHREEAIPPAHRETFGWIFKRPDIGDDGEPLWSDFREWLESPGLDMYWVTGKPGSGKSTLMKFIIATESVKTRDYLTAWSKSLPLIIAGFYFWNAGNNLQKSQLGLLRTILRQCITQQPRLAQTLFPRRFTLLRMMRHGGGLPDWGMDETLTAFKALTRMAGSSFKLALFIDGLDEFDGDHNRILETFKDARASGHMKICVSSRPWNIFKDAFRLLPSLRIEGLTRRDIEIFVHDNFSGNPGYLELQAVWPKHSRDLLQSIVDKARGVFLWVALVAGALLRRIQMGDTLLQLQKILDDLPEDLSLLFDRIWDRIDTRFRTDAARYFHLLETATKLHQPLSLQYIWLADSQGSGDDPFKRDDGIDDHTLESTMNIAARRLNSRTMMLLDVFPGYRVDYLHRTARDWLIERWDKLCLPMSPDFDPGLTLLEAALTLLSAVPRTRTSLLHLSAYDFNHRVDLLMSLAKVAQKTSDEKRMLKTIDNIDTVMTRVMNNPQTHWACPAPHACSSSQKNCFLILCASFRLQRYVHFKILENRACLDIDSSVANPLHSVLGGTVTNITTMFPTLAIRANVGWEVEVHDRVEDIKFILQQGQFSEQCLMDVMQACKDSDDRAILDLFCQPQRHKRRKASWLKRALCLSL